MIDLHLHSNASDGRCTPSQLIDICLSSNLKAIALTDHDTIDGLKEFLSYGESKDIIVLPGIEISIQHEPKRDIIDVHIVGLNIDPFSSNLKKAIQAQILGRLEQKKQICKRLREELEYSIPFDEVQKVAGSTVVGRPHIVEIMIKNNPEKVKDKTKNELFKMISLGGSAYVHRDVELNLEESIELIEHSGGTPILAHPGIYEINDKKKLVELCVDAGIKGIEIEYTYSKNRPYYNTDKAEWAQDFFPKYFNKIANDFKLKKSGGSDFHGGKKNIRVGEANVPDTYLKNFL